ncbi:MAG: glycosyltransferase family 2 protein [Acidimicrobiales bacterium]
MTQPTPSLSVCVINHNYGRFVADAIQSALAQEGDVEVIVVDDGSTDNSREVIESFGDSVRTVFKENGGQGSAFNAAIKVSTGETLLFLDADDMLEPGIAAAVIAAIADDPSVVKVQFRMRMVDHRGRPDGTLLPVRAGILPSGDLRSHVLRYRTYPWPPSSAMAYRRSAVEALLPVPEARHFNGCCDAWLSELLPVLGKVRSLDQVGAAYRRHDSNDFVGTSLRPEWLRMKIELTRATHAELVDLVREQGLDDAPVSPEAPLDAAYAGFRVASMVLQPDQHPIRSDRRLSATMQGIRGLVGNPYFGPRQTLLRSVWFLIAGLTPRPIARRAVRRWVPDGPQPPPWVRKTD